MDTFDREEKIEIKENERFMALKTLGGCTKFYAKMGVKKHKYIIIQIQGFARLCSRFT